MIPLLVALSLLSPAVERCADYDWHHDGEATVEEIVGCAVREVTGH